MTTATETRSIGMPAEAARLSATFDADQLFAELTTVRDRVWSRQRAYSGDGVGRPTEVDWRCLALRSPGGDGERTDPGGPGPEDFADTDWLTRMPYVREVLEAIPAPLHAARFMALGPDTVGIDHTDPKYGPAWGVARLHVPVTTNPDAELVLDGVTHRWQPGEFWFGDFSRTHRVQNSGTDHRIHLVVDALVTPGLARLFPDVWAEYFGSDSVLYNRPAVPQRPDQRRAAPCSFEAPADFLLWEDFGTLTGEQPSVRFAVEDTGRQLVLRAPEGQRFALVHLGDGEYRLAGWSEERTLTVRLNQPNPQVELAYREGGTVSRRVVPAVPAAGDR